MAKDKHALWSAVFRASVLHDLEPIIRLSYDTDRPKIMGLAIEPCASGGVTLAATNGALLAAVHDPSGRASGAMRVHICDRLFSGVRPPAPIIGVYEGDGVPLNLPEWAHPGSVFLTSVGGAVFPQVHYPADDPEHGHALASVIAETGNLHRGDYRLYKGELYNWRRLLSDVSGSESVPQRSLSMNPKLLFRFHRLFNRYARPGKAFVLEPGDAQAPIVVRVQGVTDFVGLIMPTARTTEDPPPFPDWTRDARKGPPDLRVVE